MNIHVFSFPPIDSKMYVILEGTKALVIDPNKNPKAITLLEKHGVKEILILLTHEHYDHISGVNSLKTMYACKVLCSAKCAELIKDAKKNQSKYFDVLMMGKRSDKNYEPTKPYECEATDVFQEYLEIKWQNHIIELKETPGHSEGCCCIMLDHKYLFTGDTLLKANKIITRFPGGSKEKYENITKPFLESFSEDWYIYPGHGESGYLKEFEIS